MASASRPAFLCTWLFYLLIWPITIILITMWDQTLYQHWVRAPTWSYTATTMPATMPADDPGEFELQRRGLGEVWARWHTDGPLGRAEFMLVALMLVGLGASFVFAGLHLPTVHAEGSLAASFRSALRGMGCAWGPLLAATIALGLTIVSVDHAQLVAASQNRFYPEEFFVFTALGVLVSSCLLLHWVGMFMRGLVPRRAAEELPPRCEGCGYNLTHVPNDGRCPECAAIAAVSLRPELRRSGAGWENALGWRRVRCWFKTNRDLLFSPTDFYRRLCVRADPIPAEQFARRHLAALSLATGALCLTMIAVGSTHRRLDVPDARVFNFVFFALVLLIPATGLLGNALLLLVVGLLTAGVAAAALPLYQHAVDSPEALFIPPLAMVALPLAGCLAHRVIGAVVATLWFVRGHLSDPRAARKVLAYEVAYLWVPWTYGFCIAAAAFLFEDEIQPLIGRFYFVGEPLEVFLFFSGLGAITLFWLHRYRLAGRAVRWANF